MAGTRNESMNIGTTSLEVAPNATISGGRKNIIFRNNSTAAADIITLSMGRPAAVAGTGIILKMGESFYDSDDGAGYECWQEEVQAVCATATGVLVIVERGRE
jgi:hypothetical protein